MRNAYNILFGEPQGKRPLGIPRHRWGIKLKWILGKWGGKVCLRSFGSRWGQ